MQLLDLTVKIENGKITTDLYRKETSKPSALLHSSAHPNHITANIAYSLAFILLRICSDEELFETRLKELRNNFLIPRNYKAKMIDTEFEKVRLLPGNTFSEKRTKALEKVEKRVEDASRIISPVDYNPHLPNISQIFRKHHKAMLINDPNLQEMFKRCLSILSTIV